MAPHLIPGAKHSATNNPVKHRLLGRSAQFSPGCGRAELIT